MTKSISRLKQKYTYVALISKTESIPILQNVSMHTLWKLNAKLQGNVHLILFSFPYTAYSATVLA